MKRIAISMGDPAGIGPEIILKTFQSEEAIGRELVVVGDASILEAVQEKAFEKQLEIRSIHAMEDAKFESGIVNVWDLELVTPDMIKPGLVSADAGNAAFQYVVEAIKLAQSGKVSSVVTAPLNKEAMHLAGHQFAGHTEIFATYTKTKDYAMLLYDEKLSVIHVSTHISLLGAIQTLTQERVERVIELAEESMVRILGRKPRIAVAGLNPHAGENGLFGREEIDTIIPAIDSMRERGIEVSGPYPPDTIFLKASQGDYDVVVAMYHDQGHIPLKLLGFHSGVNISVGMPVIRTSVDHGTAFEIAWQGIARNDSLVQAIRLAERLGE